MIAARGDADLRAAEPRPDPAARAEGPENNNNDNTTNNDNNDNNYYYYDYYY